MGQMLLAVAAALLLVQGFGAFLLYRAQDEMGEAALVHAAAFRLIAESRSSQAFRQRPGSAPTFRPGRRGFPVEISKIAPQRHGENRIADSEQRLKRLLETEGLNPSDVRVVHRRIADDTYAAKQSRRRPPVFRPSNRRISTKILVASVKLDDRDEWLVARVRMPRSGWELALPLMLQTLVIYIVLMAAVALILRRISRPLAALTGRVEQFAETRDADGQLDPEGPDDIRRLIDAHNAMEARISALLDEKDVMLGAIGHDLKTPLAALRVRIESVPDATQRDRMAATIEDIVRSLDDILSLARVGRPGDTPERTQLSALAASVVEEYEDMGRPVELGPTERIALALRPTWLRRALRNLIDNAIRYGGSARVSLELKGNNALLRVADDGPGIAENDIETMMNPFTRGDPSRNTSTGGAGLGLALAHAIAEQHGGQLTLNNRRRSDGSTEGLTATLALPLR